MVAASAKSLIIIKSGPKKAAAIEVGLYTPFEIRISEYKYMQNGRGLLCK